MRQIAIALLLTLSTDTSSAADAELEQEFRAEANAQGKVALVQISALKNTYLADMTVQAPTIGDDGSLSGTATFAGRDAPVLLHNVGGESGGVGQWLLAWRLPTRNLGELIPAMAKAAVGATGDAVQWATKATAAAASGQLLTVESARLACGLSAFEQGGQMELVVVGRIMHESLNLKLSVNTADLTNGNLFQLASQRLTPSQQSATTAGSSRGATQRAYTAGQPTSRPGRAAPTDQAARSRSPSSRPTEHSAIAPSTSPLNVVGSAPRPARTLAAAVSELQAELKASPQGAGWIKFLKLARLEQLANSDFVDVDDVSSEPYSQILKQFDSTAAKPEFKAISDNDAFIEVREMLRERAGER